jgi:hypothetical protein
MTESEHFADGYLDFGVADGDPQYGVKLPFDRLKVAEGKPDIGPGDDLNGDQQGLEKWKKQGWQAVSGPEQIDYSEETIDEVLGALERFEGPAPKAITTPVRRYQVRRSTTS